MTNHRCLIVFLLSALLFHSAYGADRTKEFREQKFKLTLPGSDWGWWDNKVPNVLACATNSAGLVLSVTAVPAPKGFYVRDTFIPGFEKGFLKEGVFAKRGGKLIKFKGTPCYQALFKVVQDKRTGAVRVFGDNDFCYQLHLLGTADPVEKRRDFESIFNAFESVVEPSKADSGKKTR